MATTPLVKIIEKDDIISLNKAITDFLATIPLLLIYNIEAGANPLYNGNKIYVAIITYDQALPRPGPVSVKLLEKDTIPNLEKAINDFTALSVLYPTIISMLEIILENGNNSYMGIIGYNIGPTNNQPPVDIASGQFLPVVTLINANVSSATPSLAQFSRVGKFVTLTGVISIVRIADGLVMTVDFTIPIPSLFSGGIINAAGTVVDRGSNQNGDCGTITAVFGGTLRIRITPTATASNGYAYTCGYFIN